MKFKFKAQPYQNDAVNCVCDVFNGQAYQTGSSFLLVDSKKTGSIPLFKESGNGFVSQFDEEFDYGFANPKLNLTNAELLSNVKKIQAKQNIKESDSLSNVLGNVELDIEMETGTGKTYVYIKTMFELNRRYGFSKFIVVVPSIAIREGVKKTFEMTVDHFMDEYGKKARFFIYNSRKLDEIEHFSDNDSINVMIINIQAFNSRGADARRIYEELDDFQSRRPIDVISKNNPILILDEPQKMSGVATQESLKRFTPLFSINYSATHRITHNLVYVLDAVDAYNKKLVKKIEVKGFTINHLKGTNGYLYLQDIILSTNKPPIAKIEFELRQSNGKISRVVKSLKTGDSIFKESGEMVQYEGNFVISEINPFTGIVTFLNGISLSIGNAFGDVSENDTRRIQIRETIKSHIEKEEELFKLGIKTLSLFFIDEVAKYRQYDEEGNELNSVYGEIFEDEYRNLVNDYCSNHNNEYSSYLKKTNAEDVHKGYFSIDKRGRKINSVPSKGTDLSDDVSAYDLILKDKERLLSFEEPTRFIFSHSALREGWDNPNIFQICTLKYSSSDIQRRQEVGRGLRLCVNINGDRMDSSVPNFDVHSINRLTVIANESYEDFVNGLQKDIKATLYERPKQISKDFFIGKTVVDSAGSSLVLGSAEARQIYKYLIINDYIDENDRPTDTYKNDLNNSCLELLPEPLEAYSESIHTVIKSVYDESAIGTMITNANQARVQNNPLNDNFYKKEFQTLWSLINHKYAYYVQFSTDELIQKAVEEINRTLFVNKLSYVLSTGSQKSTINSEDVSKGDSFKTTSIKTEYVEYKEDNRNKYDIVGEIAKATKLTRKTIATTLAKISKDKFDLFRENPEDFISKISKIINEQKATLIVDHVYYNEIDGCFDSSIFTESKSSSEFASALKAIKHIKDYVFVDGINKTDSVERVFAEQLDVADEVVVYAKLPRTFYIPTPVGNYSPDWAIAFKEGSVKHIYFLAETKGSLETMQLRGVEKAKIECAKKLFNKMSGSKVRYEHVTTYKQLLDKINSLA